MKREKNFKYVLLGLILAVILVTECPMYTYAGNAALGQVKSQLNLLLDLVSTVVSVLGSVVTLWGISEWGLSLQGGNGGMMEAQGFKRILGGVVMILATNLLAIFAA